MTFYDLRYDVCFFGIVRICAWREAIGAISVIWEGEGYLLLPDETIDMPFDGWPVRSIKADQEALYIEL